MSSLQSLSDYGLGESDIEDSDEEVSKEDQPVIPFVPKVQVYQPRVVSTSSRLVSYGEDEDEEGKPSEMVVDVEDPVSKIQESNVIATENAENAVKKEEKENIVNKEDLVQERKPNIRIQLPPEPTGRCSNSLQDKIINLLEKKHKSKIDWNAAVQKKKNFRNPSIYEKLISYCNIQENGTNYPKELFDPEAWAKEPNYEMLAKQQKEANEKKAKRTHIEFMSGTKKSAAATTEDTKKRKSKWDISAAGVPPRTATPPIPPGVGVVPGLARVITEAAATAAKKAKLEN